MNLGKRKRFDTRFCYSCAIVTAFWLTLMLTPNNPEDPNVVMRFFLHFWGHLIFSAALWSIPYYIIKALSDLTTRGPQ